MPLADDIQDLMDRTFAALDASHDYYTYTKRTWRFVQEIIKEGREISFRNPTTRTRVDKLTLLRQSRLYLTNYLAPWSFQHFVSLFEDFVFELLRTWLVACPGSLSKKTVDVATILKAVDTRAVLLTVVDKELNELKYERLADWFAYLERLTHVGCPSTDEIQRLAEIKASRDILVHNNGLANATYLSKAGSLARYRAGEQLQIPEKYHRESWETIKRVVGDLATALIAKA
jgi:hypothetical protein